MFPKGQSLVFPTADIGFPKTVDVTITEREKRGVLEILLPRTLTTLWGTRKAQDGGEGGLF